MSMARLCALPTLERCSHLQRPAATANELWLGHVRGHVPCRCDAHRTHSLPCLEHLALKLHPPQSALSKASQPHACCSVCPCPGFSLSCQVIPGTALRVSRWTPVFADGRSHQSLQTTSPSQGSAPSLSITAALRAPRCSRACLAGPPPRRAGSTRCL